jgi:hypothetical protein
MPTVEPTPDATAEHPGFTPELDPIDQAVLAVPGTDTCFQSLARLSGDAGSVSLRAARATLA